MGVEGQTSVPLQEVEKPATPEVEANTSSAGHKYLLTGGGTGGHVYPAIAIADELRRREPDASFLYVGV